MNSKTIRAIGITMMIAAPWVFFYGVQENHWYGNPILTNGMSIAIAGFGLFLSTFKNVHL